ncbi:hypothetical protein Tco_1040350, partial [Tanacetum coccineum]
MPKVVTIAPELFLSLEVLELENMHVDCSKLDDVLIGKISSLRVILRMERSSEAVLTSIIGASSSIISLKMDNISGLTPLHGEVLHHMGIISCRNMKSFPHTLLPTLASLKVLLITNCPLMESFLCCSWPPKNRTLKKAYVRMGTSEFLNTLVNWIQALDDKGEYRQMLSQDGIYVITTLDYQFGETFETHYGNQPQIYERISSELKKLERISSLIEDLLKDAEINEN